MSPHASDLNEEVHVVALEWHDGPTSGYIRRSPSEVFAFDLAGSPLAEPRLFVLREVKATFDEVLNLLPSARATRGRIWMPFSDLNEVEWNRELHRIRGSIRSDDAIVALLATTDFTTADEDWRLIQTLGERALVAELLSRPEGVVSSDLDRFSAMG